MGDAESVQPKGEKIKKALVWVSETLQDSPQLSRKVIIEKAQVRFNLSPKESEFLRKNFTDIQ